jgi:hypothetical protein
MLKTKYANLVIPLILLIQCTPNPEKGKSKVKTAFGFETLKQEHLQNEKVSGVKNLKINGKLDRVEVKEVLLYDLLKAFDEISLGKIQLGEHYSKAENRITLKPEFNDQIKWIQWKIEDSLFVFEAEISEDNLLRKFKNDYHIKRKGKQIWVEMNSSQKIAFYPADSAKITMELYFK